MLSKLDQFGGDPPCPLPAAYSNLSSTTVDEQLDTGDVGAVVGSEEHRRFAQIIWRADAAERNGSNDSGFFFIRHEMGKAWRIGVSGRLVAGYAPSRVLETGTGTGIVTRR